MTLNQDLKVGVDKANTWVKIWVVPRQHLAQGNCLVRTGCPDEDDIKLDVCHLPVGYDVPGSGSGLCKGPGGGMHLANRRPTGLELKEPERVVRVEVGPTERQLSALGEGGWEQFLSMPPGGSSGRR